MRYGKEASALWKKYVPKSGQAGTVQGELIRSVGRLRDEAQRNGNINWGKNHAILARYLRDTLIRSGLFDQTTVEEIRRDIKRVMDIENPEVEDEPWDRLVDHVVEWSFAHPDPIAREHNPKLTM